MIKTYPYVSNSIPNVGIKKSKGIEKCLMSMKRNIESIAISGNFCKDVSFGLRIKLWADNNTKVSTQSIRQLKQHVPWSLMYYRTQLIFVVAKKRNGKHPLDSRMRERTKQHSSFKLKFQRTIENAMSLDRWESERNVLEGTRVLFQTC